MDRRTVLALVLVAAVILLTPRFFTTGPVVPAPGVADSAVADTSTPPPATPPPATAAPAPTVRADTAIPEPVAAAPLAPPETVVVANGVARYRFSNEGGVLHSVDMLQYRDLRDGQGIVSLRGEDAPLIRFFGIAAGDTIHFDSLRYAVAADTSGPGGSVTMTGGLGADSLTLRFDVVPDSYVVRVTGQATGRLASEPRSYMLLSFSPTLRSYEADSVDHQRNLAFTAQPARDDARGIGFGSLDPGQREVVPGPLTWVALKSKYFIVGALTTDTSGATSPIVEFQAVGGPRVSRVATRAYGTAVIELDGGRFELDLYTGPQQWQRLRAIGRNFESANPYGGFMQPIVQPFAVLVMRILLWLRHTFDIGYGWVLVIFGVAVRLVLWPLNQSAMRTSIKMQRIQPELQDIQKRYKNDPQKLQTEMMRVYKEHGMSPFSMFSGCLPLLIPMPVLFALFFVFQSTIEFRGVSFLWLEDISLKDPYYILPILMGASMFLLSWIGSRNTPPNPQTKVMMYVFPFMMTFLLANFAAGLNLYYAVQNVAALPQQWFIARERAKGAPPRPARK